MRFGFVLPGGSAVEQMEHAVRAEQAGWDGIFAWEAAYGVEPWTLLSAIAQRTQRLRLGTMLTPLPWRRPWKLASQVATLDQLSGGRAILAVGLGAIDPELGETPEEKDRGRRAAMLDEGIDLIRGFWEGRLRFEGQHYRIDLSVRPDFARAAQPVQQRIPIWVVGAWPGPRSMRRVLRCDGLLPAAIEGGRPRGVQPEDVRAMRAWLVAHGARADLDIISEGETPAHDPERAREQVRPWAEASCTWWLETRWDKPEAVVERIQAGPPRAPEPASPGADAGGLSR
ncbi:MAG: LLM class flavin-dependent oxidoreductase [Chloroflexota bacterium]|nr:LLM class flavin-dependent oxidoreductase [Chloroflexota bacterium]